MVEPYVMQQQSPYVMQHQLPYIMQHQLPDIENTIHREHAGKIDNIEKKILKLEKHVAEIEEIVDTTGSGKCARCFASFLSLGFTILMIYVAVKVLH